MIGTDHGAYGEANDYHTRKVIIKTKCMKQERVLNVSNYTNSMNISLSGSDNM
jgi:hypothetical protein